MKLGVEIKEPYPILAGMLLGNSKSNSLGMGGIGARIISKFNFLQQWMIQTQQVISRGQQAIVIVV
jgi:hypothetical protein